MDAHRIAQQRVDAMHAAVADIVNPPFGLHAMVGAAIDSHIALLSHKPPCRTVFIAYRLDLAPENSVANVCSLAGVEKLVLSLWKCCADHGSLRRLLLKGGPFPTSVRYVAAQLRRTASHPDTRDAVTKILRLSMLGAYQHCKFIALPRQRVRIHSLSGVDLLARFGVAGNRTSHHYFYLVAEFVMAATRASPQVWHWVLSHARYPEYERIVSLAGDVLRQGGRPARVSAAIAPKSWDPPATKHSFTLCANGTRKMSLISQKLLLPTKIASIYADVLRSTRWGYAGDVLAHMPNSSRVRAMVNAPTDATMRRAHGHLTNIEASTMQVIAHAIDAKATFTVSATTENVRRLQARAVRSRTGADTHFVLVCACCATWRSKAPITGISRGAVGVKVSMPIGHGVSCNSCKQVFGIRQVNLVGQIIRIRPRVDMLAVQVSICTLCGSPSSDLAHIGVNWACKRCATNSMATAAVDMPGCYVCTVPHVYTFAARRDGIAIVVGTCGAHRPNIEGVANVDISAVKRMIKLRSRRSYSVRRRVAGDMTI